MKRLEVLANIAVITTALLLSSILIKNYVLPKNTTGPSVQAPQSKPSSTNTSKSQPIQNGTKISVQGVDWSKSNRTILLVLSTKCHFCTDSAPFYQRIQQEKPNDLRLIAVLPQPIEDSRAYLTRLGISVSDVVQAPLSIVGVSGTPTVMLVDAQGQVNQSWVGKIAEPEEADVLTRIKNSITQ